MADAISNNKNFGSVYRMIYNEKQTSRQDIADELNLSLPTVTNVLSLLKKENLIYNAGQFSSTGGRKANILSCVPTARYSVGVDITRHHISIAVIDMAANIIDKKRIRCKFVDSDAYYKQISDELDALLTTHQVPRDKILGVGISMPVIFNTDSKTIYYASVINTEPGTYERIQRHFDFPCLLFNDANSAGLAESWVSTSDHSILYLSLSNSVGGATMNAKTISYGNNNRASEFGHMCIVPNGKKCYCGSYGCLDAYCSALALSDLTDGNLSEFFEQLDTNIGFQRIFDDYLNYLALAVHNLRMCYDCDIIIGGYVGAYMTEHIDTLRSKVTASTPFEDNADFIQACHYKNEAAAVGAAIPFITQFVQEL